MGGKWEVGGFDIVCGDTRKSERSVCPFNRDSVTRSAWQEERRKAASGVSRPFRLLTRTCL